MAHRWKNDLKERDATPEAHWLSRRKVIAAAGAGLGLGGMALGGMALGGRTLVAGAGGGLAAGAAPGRAAAKTDALKPTAYEDITSYCNYYEFGTGKGDPARYAHMLTTDPWSVKIDGLVERPGEYALEDILAKMTIEERIYRFRCVEAWSMVVPWNGFELADLLDLAGVKAGAKYVAFETVLRPDEMPGTRLPLIDWPYVEGLRLDEAMHPLTIMATGIYGKDLLGQNGAPLRLVVPWKYGFKSIKSVVRITLTAMQPPTTWNEIGPNEYGFYSNVNPEVDHPRWSQAHERVIGTGLFARKVPTRMFNGYADDVAGLYEGMDLKEYY